jgi:hypothetical protein
VLHQFLARDCHRYKNRHLPTLSPVKLPARYSSSTYFRVLWQSSATCKLFESIGNMGFDTEEVVGSNPIVPTISPKQSMICTGDFSLFLLFQGAEEC